MTCATGGADGSTTTAVAITWLSASTSSTYPGATAASLLCSRKSPSTTSPSPLSRPPPFLQQALQQNPTNTSTPTTGKIQFVNTNP